MLLVLMVNLGTAGDDGCWAILIVNLGTTCSVVDAVVIVVPVSTAAAFPVVAFRMVNLGMAVTCTSCGTASKLFIRMWSLGMTSSSCSFVLLTTGTGFKIGLMVIFGGACTWLGTKLTSGDPPNLITVRIGSLCKFIFSGSTFRDSCVMATASSFVSPRISIIGRGEVDNEEDRDEAAEEDEDTVSVSCVGCGFEFTTVRSVGPSLMT